MIQILLVKTNELPLFRDMLPEEYTFGLENEYLLGALTEDGTACGVLHFRFADYRYELLFIGIHPAFRRRGLGTELMRRFLDSVYESEILYPVYVSYEDRPEYYEFEKMLKSMNCFYFDDDTTLFLMTPECRQASTLYIKLLNSKRTTAPFFDQPEKTINKFLKDQEDAGLNFLEDFESRKDTYCKELCKCVVKKGKIIAAVLCSVDENKNVSMEYVYSRDSGGMALYTLFSGVISAIEKDYANNNLYLHAVNDISYSICDKIFGDNSEQVTVIEAQWDFSFDNPYQQKEIVTYDKNGKITSSQLYYGDKLIGENGKKVG